MKLSSSLEMAKAKLCNTRGGQGELFICMALKWLWASSYLTQKEYDEARQCVEQHIRPHVTLASYLYSKKEIPDRLLRRTEDGTYAVDVGSPRYFAIRDQWLDALIRQLKSEGK